MAFDDEILTPPREEEEEEPGALMGGATLAVGQGEEIDYGQLVKDQQEAQSVLVKETLRAQEKVDPARRAEAVRLSDVYKVPVDVVERNLDVFRAQAREDFPAYQDLIAQAPKVADWIIKHSDRAAAAHDDMPALIKLENQLTFGASILRGIDNTQAMWGRFLEWSGEATGRKDLAQYGRGIAVHNEAQSAALGKTTTLAEVFAEKHEGRQWALFAQWLKETAGEQIPMVIPSIVGGVAGGGIAAGAVGILGLGVKAAQWLPRIGSALGAFGMNWPRSIGEAQQQLKEVGPEAEAPLEVFIGGSAIAALDSALPGKVGVQMARTFGRETAEAVLHRALMAPLKPRFLRRTVGGAVSGFAIEGITEAIQEAVGYVAAAAGADVPVDWNQTLQAMIEAGAKGAVVGGGMGGASAAFTHHTEVARWAAAMQQEHFFNALAAAAQDSKLLQRLPEAYQQFVQEATQNGPVSTVYAPTGTFITYWQSQNLSPEMVAAELTGNPTALDEAVAAGTDLAIPTAVYATRIAPTEHHAFFAREVKLDPTLMNAREAGEVREALEAQAEAFEAAMAGAPAKPKTEIGTSIVAQLVADPQFQALAVQQGVEVQEAAETYAAQVEAAFVTLGERIGEDPLKHFARYGLRIGPGALPAPPVAVGEGGAPLPSPAAPPPLPAEPGLPAAVPGVPPGEPPELGYEQPPGVPLHPLAVGPAEVRNGRLLVSTRLPSAVRAPAAPGRLRTDLEAATAGRTLLARFSPFLRHAPVLRVEESRQGTAGEVIERLVNRMVDNLRWLYDSMPEALRERARVWYVGAHRIAQDLADEFDLTDEQSAAVVAVLSPNREWYTNVAMAERVMRWYRHCEATDPAFTPELMTHAVATWRAAADDVMNDVRRRSGEAAARRYRQRKEVEIVETEAELAGVRWSAMALDGQARLLRALDEMQNTSSYHVILPEGERGDLVRTAKGRPAKLGWTSFDIIGDAIALMRDGSVENINERLGAYHKVRSFFNNISDPWDDQSVTIDTHAIAAALLIPVSSGSSEVKFAMDRPEDTLLGVHGTNPVYAEAYFRLARELGILPRELQSIVWEAGRGLFVAAAKSRGLPEAVRHLWQQFRTGKLTEEQVRAEILAVSGPVRSPAWADTPPRVALDESGLRQGHVQPLRPELPTRRRDGGAYPEGAPRRNTALRDGLVVPGAVYAQEPAAGPADIPAGLRPAERRAAVRSRLGRLSRSQTQPYAGGGRGGAAEAGRVVQTFAPVLPFRHAFEEIGYPTPTLVELNARTQAGEFRSALRRAKAESPLGAQVYLYDESDYQEMRVFLTEDSRSGFALKSDGDIVSVFSGGGGQVHALIALAVQEGGRKLDCFDTMLPVLYGVNGFRIVGRDPWNDAFAPDGWDFEAMRRFNGGRPDVVYMEYDEATLQQPVEQVFFQTTNLPHTEHEWAYSRLRRSVELATLAKASGRQWKATIQNSKIGINRDEFLFARLADLDDDTTYTKQEVLDYLATNSLRVEWVVFGDPAITGPELEAKTEAAYEEAVQEKIRELEDADVAIPIEGGIEFDEQTQVWRLIIDGEQIGPNYQTETEAYNAESEFVDAHRERQIDDLARSSVSYSTAELIAETRAEVEALRQATQFEAYQYQPGEAVEGSYREVILHAPQFGYSGFQVLSRADNELLRRRMEPVLMKLRTYPFIGTDAMNTYLAHEIVGMNRVKRGLPMGERLQIQAGIEVLQRLIEANDYTFRPAGWKDGHAQYASVENPIVRLRFSRRQLQDGRVGLFLEEVQPPNEVNFEKMPPLLQKQWREIGFKWALAHAVDQGLSFVAWTTGQVQRSRYRLGQMVDAIGWGPTQQFTDDWNDGARTNITVAVRGQRGRSGDHRVGVAVDDQGKIAHVAFDDKASPLVQTWPGKHLAEVVGKTIADQILSTPVGSLKEEGLEIGGEGLARLYDVDFVNVVNHLPAVKKAGVQVGTVPVVRNVIEMPQPARGRRRARPPLIETDDMHAVEITPPVAEAVSAGQALFQEEGARARGRTIIGEGRQIRIELLKDANLSTFVHECGHVYLEVLADIAAELRVRDPATLTAGQAGVLRDFDTLLRWFGVTDRSEIGVTHHEQFARAFEKYLRRGGAPSVRLRTAFARFKAWLLALYKTDDELRVILSRDVAEVFDRLLASDAAIAEARAEARLDPLFTTAEDAGMTPGQFDAYRKAIHLAHEAARDSLEARLLQELRATASKQQAARRQVIETEVRAEVSQQPIQRALVALQRGQLPDGTALPEPIKLSRAAIVAKWGEARLKTLPLPWVYSAEGGVDPDAVAELWGFSSGDELLTQLAAAPKLDAAVRDETNRRMRVEFGDMQNDGSLRELATRAVQENGYEAILAAELRALARKAREVRPFVREAEARVRAEEQEAAQTASRQKAEAARMARRQALQDVRRVIPIELVRGVAAARIAGMKVRDIKPHLFWAAARRAGQLALEAAIKGDYETAYQEKQRQRLAVELYRQAHEALDEVAGIVRLARRLTQTPARARLGKAGQSYLDQVDGILDKFEFARVSAAALDRRATLQAWLQEREDEGLPVDGIPADVIEAARAVNYAELPVDQLRTVRDTLRQIEHLARLKTKLLRNRDTRAFEALRDEVVNTIQAQASGRPMPIEFRQADERRHTIGEWFASHKKIAILARALDGHHDNGPVWRAIIRPLNEAADQEQERRRVEGQKLADIIRRHYPGRDLAAWHQKRFIPLLGRSLSKEGCLAVALNWGNESSRQRLLNDPRRRWNEAQIGAILDTLDRRDWQFVQAVWDYVDTFWPEIAEKQRRVTGLAPEKVEAVAVQTRFGTFRGGYYPLAYDSRMAGRPGHTAAAAEAKLQMQAAYVRTTTRRGHVETRLQHVELPVRLDLGVLFAHLDQVIHDLTHHEVLIDVSRMLRNRAVSGAMIDSAGDAVYRQFTTALTDIAVGGRVGQNMLDRAATFMKTGTQIAQLGFNLWTSLQQPLGLFNGMARVGPVWVARGLKRWLFDAARMENTARWINERSLMMRSRAQTATQDLSDLRASLAEPGGWFDQLLRTASGNRVTRQRLFDSYLWHIGLAQRVADIPTWLGAYEKALATTTADEETAGRLADQAVLDAQGGGLVKDLSQVQRGGPVARLFLTFYSYGSTVYNATADVFGETRWKSPLSIARFLGNLSLIYFFPAVCTVALSRLLGRTGDEDDDESTFVVELGEELLATALNTMVLVRELGGLVRGGQVRGWSGPSGARAVQMVYNLAQQAAQGEADEGLWKALNATAGVLFRYPAAQVQKTIDGWVALQEGESENPAALIVGPTRQR